MGWMGRYGKVMGRYGEADRWPRVGHRGRRGVCGRMLLIVSNGRNRMLLLRSKKARYSRYSVVRGLLGHYCALLGVC